MSSWGLFQTQPLPEEAVAKEDRRGKYHCCLMYDTFIHNAKFLEKATLKSTLFRCVEKTYLGFSTVVLGFFHKMSKEKNGC